MSTWLPIETAPKGEFVLLTNGYHIVAGEYNKMIRYTNIIPFGLAGYDWSWDFDEDTITHWMPLPEPPKDE